MEKLRKTEAFKILISKKQANRNTTEYVLEELKSHIILKEFFDYFYQANLFDEKKSNKYTIKSKNMCYYIDSVSEEEDLKKVKMKYIKYNKQMNVVDVQTLTRNYTKSKNEGDEEKQHYLIKIFKNTNRAVLIWEKIIGAVTIGMIESNLNKTYRDWVKQYKEDNKKLLLEYNIKIEVVPSPKFVEELMKLEKISLIKVIVDKENLTKDEDILFSEDNISRDEVELLYRPVQTLSFSKAKVRSYYEKFENQSNRQKIKRLVIQGRKDKNAIRLDTEGMKLSEYIKTKVDIDGLVDSESIFDKYTDLVNKNFKEYFNNIFIDVGLEEGEE